MTVLVAAHSASPSGFEEITQAPSFLARYLRLKRRYYHTSDNGIIILWAPVHWILCDKRDSWRQVKAFNKREIIPATH
jgi:hypothetical protein